MKLMKTTLCAIALSFLMAIPGMASTQKIVKNSFNDTNPGFLCGIKIVAGSNITLIEQNDGGDESCQINALLAGSGVVLDLLDDGSNESVALSEIAFINSGSVATEPSADKLLLDFNSLLFETELDSEAKLEAALADVSDVFTNLDGALDDDDITDDSLSDLSDVTAKSGNTTIIGTTSGALTPGNLAEWDASGNLIDSGIAASTSPVNDIGLFIEPVTDGDGYKISDSGGTKGLEISHNGTTLIFDIIGASPEFAFPDLANCDTIDTDANGKFVCGSDATTGLGSAEILDLGDDSINEETDITEIATVNDTNSIATNPTAGKLLIDMAQNWPTADVADEVTCTGCVADGELSTDFIAESELDSEGELEAQLVGVVNVFTDNDVIDVSDNTNLASGRSTTVNGDAVDADVELYERMSNASMITPTDADDGFIQIKFAHATTIARVSCSTDVGTATIQLDERVETTPNTPGTDIMTAVLVCDSNMEATTSFVNATIAADSIVNVDFDATATTPGIVRIHIDKSAND